MEALPFEGIRCAHCDAPVGAEVHPIAAVARCSCGKVLDLAPFVLAQRVSARTTAGAAVEPVVPRPEAVQVLAPGQYRVDGARAYLPYRLLIPGFVFLVGVGFSMPLEGLVWKGLAGLFGVVMAGLATSVLWGHWLLSVSDGLLRVRWWPLPVRGGQLRLASIKKLVVDQRTEQLGRSSLEPVWNLVAITADGEVPVLPRLADPLAAAFLKQELERLQLERRGGGR